MPGRAPRSARRACRARGRPAARDSCDHTNSPICGASAASAGTATPHAASRLKKRPGSATSSASGRALKSRAGAWSQIVASVRVGSPSSPTSTLSSAPAGSTPSRIARTQPIASESRSVPSSWVTSRALARLNGSTWRSSVTSIASSVSSSGTSPVSVRTTNAPAPSWASTVTRPRQRSESLSHDSTSASGWSAGKRRQQLLHRLRRPRVRRHAPVLATPVEPPPWQLLDRFVQIRVELEGEHELALAAPFAEHPDSTLVRHQSIQISEVAGVPRPLGANREDLRSSTLRKVLRISCRERPARRAGIIRRVTIVVAGEALFDLVLTEDGAMRAHPGGGPVQRRADDRAAGRARDLPGRDLDRRVRPAVGRDADRGRRRPSRGAAHRGPDHAGRRGAGRGRRRELPLLHGRHRGGERNRPRLAYPAQSTRS